MDEKNQFDQSHQPHQENEEQNNQDQVNHNHAPVDYFETPGIYGNRDEETAAELRADDVDNSVNIDDDDDDDIDVNSAIGWVSVALAAISFFWLPILFGAAAIITGFVARNRHANVLGNIAIVAGAIAIIMSLFMRPFF